MPDGAFCWECGALRESCGCDRPRIYDVDRDMRELFNVRITHDGTYFAVRESGSPRFAVSGSTIVAAVEKAVESLDFYKRISESALAPKDTP